MKRLITFLITTSLTIAPIAFAFPMKALAQEPKPLVIRSSPSYPAAFQRVILSLVIPRGEIADEATIEWRVNDELVNPESNYPYYSFRTGKGSTALEPNIYKITAIYYGTKGTYRGEMTIKPYVRDISPGDNLTRSLLCTANTLDMMANNLDGVALMVEKSVNEITAMFDQLVEDYEFVIESAFVLTDDIVSDGLAIANIYSSMSLSLDTASLKTVAMGLRKTVLLLTRGGTIQRIKHLEKILTRYKNLEKTIDAKIKARQRYLKNLQDQTNRQIALCQKQINKINTSLNR
ncbi:MAG TPA: hypothetical protein VJ579_01860 [Candidatus Paceibacterota bacterium]|nr:hypothetical protein [Candidatus Paceibacterota bacterium]